MGNSINREKVVKGLTICRHKAISQENCMECPYIYDKRSKQSSCECVLHDDTLKLLKEQEEEIGNLKQTAQSMMEGVCLLKEQELPTELKQKMWNTFYAEEDEYEKKFVGKEEHHNWFSVYRPWLQEGFNIAIKAIAEWEGR